MNQDWVHVKTELSWQYTPADEIIEEYWYALWKKVWCFMNIMCEWMNGSEMMEYRKSDWAIWRPRMNHNRIVWQVLT